LALFEDLVDVDALFESEKAVHVYDHVTREGMHELPEYQSHAFAAGYASTRKRGRASRSVT
jgi:hypothetical protein